MPRVGAAGWLGSGGVEACCRSVFLFSSFASVFLFFANIKSHNSILLQNVSGALIISNILADFPGRLFDVDWNASEARLSARVGLINTNFTGNKGATFARNSSRPWLTYFRHSDRCQTFSR